MTPIQKTGRVATLRRILASTAMAICVVPLMNLAAEAQSADHGDKVDVAAVHVLAQLETAPGGDPDMAKEDEVSQMLEAKLAEAPWHPVRWFGLSE